MPKMNIVTPIPADAVDRLALGVHEVRDGVFASYGAFSSSCMAED